MHATYVHETYAKWPRSDIDTYTADGDCGDDDNNQCDYADGEADGKGVDDEEDVMVMGESHDDGDGCW